MTTELDKLYALEEAAYAAYEAAQADVVSAQRLTERRRVEHLRAEYNREEAEFKQRREQLAALEAEVVAATPAVHTAIINAPPVARDRKAEPMSAEKIARHLGYGSSGRTRAEISKTLDQAVTKVGQKLKGSAK